MISKTTTGRICSGKLIPNYDNSPLVTTYIEMDTTGLTTPVPVDGSNDGYLRIRLPAFRGYTSGGNGSFVHNGQTYRQEILYPVTTSPYYWLKNIRKGTQTETSRANAYINNGETPSAEGVLSDWVNATDDTLRGWVLLKVSDFFDDTNPTTQVAEVGDLYCCGTYGKYAKIYQPNGAWSTGSIMIGSTEGEVLLGTVSIKYAVPPTFNTSELTSNNNFYPNVSTASVTISDSEAKCGGYITASSFTLGSHTTTGTGDGTLTVPITETGTFIPTVTVTDSRGVTATKELSEITIAYPKPSLSAVAERCDNTGAREDDGNNGIVEATINYVDDYALLEPSVTITHNGTDYTPTIAWYENWDADNGVSSAINWSDYHPASPAQIYGLITGYGSVTGLDTNDSFQISITPNTEYSVSGLAITLTLAQAYYTVDFLAGGHGIAFGQPASQDGFYCNMDATFNEDLVAQDMTAQEVSDFVDGLDAHGEAIRHWQGFQSKTGTAVIDISGLDYEELYIKVTITGNNVGGLHIPKTALPSSVEYHRFGGWQANANSELVILAVSQSTVNLNSAYINGGNYTSSAITSVYYR